MSSKYSGKEVIKAGETFLYEGEVDSDELNRAMDILSYWRFEHEYPLENAFELLKEKSIKKDKGAIFAKRLKRYASIVSKLKRFRKMKLKNMQDIGGCRAIVSSEKKLYQIVRELRKKENFKNGDGVVKYKDYIKNPKDDGYRGYHLIGIFKDKSGGKKSIELQVRTVIQHDWATALEIVDLFTGQALKSNQGEAEWKDFFKLVSDHFSLMEGIHLFTSKNDSEQFIEYEKLINKNPDYLESGLKIQEYESRLKIVKSLQAYAHSLKVADDHISEHEVDGYVLLRVDTAKKQVESTIFSDSNNEDAERKYIEYEKESASKQNIVVALVSTTAVGGIKEAYPNYFADSTDFLKYLLHIINAPFARRKTFFERWLKRTGL
ncbi:RelA/SpoT domain-containing protein [Marinobacter sp. 71-i]|uniref:RelA/SpoT domain-containing protein n=1 Tax=Marinobacter iranensis TaxID=2962607 RepID=A0ABT5YGL7_9GAMM|nr:RelA/SpoT domain-containing protein [Marinobacter iranensis]MDF0752719.1 RelA/SpoT domain-containing protein [Marinobacter iranensis]